MEEISIVTIDSSVI